MSAAAGAGTGAAIGSAISPGLGTIIGAGLGLIGGLFGNSSDKSINKQQIEYNKWALAQQERYNWDMWNATNAYNDPSAEKARYARAGINPAVMFKSGLSDQASLGSGIDPEGYNPHPVRTPFDSWVNGNDPFTRYQQMYQIHKIKSDIDNTNMDTKKKESEKNKVDEEVNLIQIQEKTEAAKATIAEIDADYHDEIVQAGLDKQYEEIDKLIQDVENAKTQNDLMKSEEALNKALQNFNNWKAKEIKDLLQPRIEAVYAEVKKALADANEANARAGLIGSEKWAQDFENDVLRIVCKNDSVAAKRNELGKKIQDYEVAESTKKQIDKYVELLSKENDNYKIKLYSGILIGLLGAAGKVAPLAKP